MNTTDILGVVGKSILIFGIGYLFIRLMKKHSMGATTPFDFLITVLLGTILAGPLVSERMELAILYAGVIVLSHIVASKLVLLRPIRRYLAFKPAVLVSKDNIDESALTHERVTIPHLLSELRVKGYS